MPSQNASESFVLQIIGANAKVKMPVKVPVKVLYKDSKSSFLRSDA
jgi:hypothetical protein